jgi:hypothetical protein
MTRQREFDAAKALGRCSVGPETPSARQHQGRGSSGMSIEAVRRVVNSRARMVTIGLFLLLFIYYSFLFLFLLLLLL